MNWRRGLFWFWLVGSGIWLVLVMVLASNMVSSEDMGSFFGFIVFLLGVALVPPLAVFIIGRFLVWTFKGFQRR